VKLNLHKGKTKDFRVQKQNRKRQQQYLKNKKKNRKNIDPVGQKLNVPTKSVLRINRDNWDTARKEVFGETFKKRNYKEAPKHVKLEGYFGVESDLDGFLEKAEEFVETKSSRYIFDLKKCARMWPSGILLLVSLTHWWHLTSATKNRPLRGSIDPESEAVDSYLDHCGFYNYVKAEKRIRLGTKYSSDEVVKIVRETSRANQETRHNEIYDLIKRRSALSDDELEWFNCVILTEILANVSEHGVYHTEKAETDYGWYNLTQCHPTHGFISICFADNGIGIKNSLVSGLQREELKAILPQYEDNDGEYIKKSFEENVSGAYAASLRERKWFRKKYPRGKRRGNGLKRILDTCKLLKIPILIVSSKGAVSIDEKGRMRSPVNKPKMVFAGTLIHLRVPAKKKEELEL